MLFKDLKVGDTLYLFNKSNISLLMEKVVSVSAPRVDSNIAMGMVVDISISNKTYTMKESSDICYTGNFIISSDRNSILREVESQKANNEALIAREEILKAEQPKLDSIIDQLAPERKERKEQEERMHRMEKQLGALTNMVEQLIKNRKSNNNNG